MRDWQSVIALALEPGGELLPRAMAKSEFIRLSDCRGIVEGMRRVQVVTIDGASKTSRKLVISVRRCRRYTERRVAPVADSSAMTSPESVRWVGT